MKPEEATNLAGLVDASIARLSTFGCLGRATKQRRTIVQDRLKSFVLLG
jgi:hypothetical protein